MFFLTYLARELRRRVRQALFIALGLAVGIGLVITVLGASSGVKTAQAKMLRSLYGIGTDITITQKPKPPSGQPGNGGTTFKIGPGGAQVCDNGKCHQASGGAIDNLVSANFSPLASSTVAKVAALHGVAAAAGALDLIDNKITLPGKNSSGLTPPTSFSVTGIDIPHSKLGPLSSGKLSSGRRFTTADANATRAVVDSNYATSHSLKVGSTITVAGTKFTVIGIVTQPQGSTPPNVYIPLATASKLAINPRTNGKLTNDVNTIYVTAASSADIPAVQREISKLLPSATITSSSDLASQVTGSLASTAKLANDLGKWLAVLVLIAAFAVASLLTMAAVSRRVREFGTLKALGWRSRRIVGQVLGESVGTGIIGGIVGVGLGFAGVAIIDKVAPKLSATISSGDGPSGFHAQTFGGGPSAGPQVAGAPSSAHTIAVPMSASVTIGAIVLAVLLAVAGGVLAGSFGGWRAARLRPATALAKVG